MKWTGLASCVIARPVQSNCTPLPLSPLLYDVNLVKGECRRVCRGLTMPEWGDRAPWSCWWLWTVAKERHSDGNRRFTVFLSERTAGRILTKLEQKGHCGSGDTKLAAARLCKNACAAKAISFSLCLISNP